MGVLNMMKAISRIREGETWQVGENMAGGGRHDRGKEGGMTGASPVTTIYGTYIGSRWAVFSMN